MYTIAYSKNSKKIILSHYDETTGTPPDPHIRLADHCKLNGLNVNDYVAMVYPYDETFKVVFGKHVFNEATQQIDEDPNYVEPTPPPDPVPSQGTPA